MPFKINFELSKSIPTLAWIAIYEPKSNNLKCIHGNMVETSTLGLVEGAWDGDFPSFDFHRTSVFSGTGFCHHDNELLFCSSTDQISPIFSLKSDGRLYISNSPVFLMTHANTSPIPSYPYYHFNLLNTYRQGLHSLKGPIPLSKGIKMNVHFAAILTISDTGNISYHTHPAGRPPKDFHDYHSILTSAVNSVIKNANHKNRKHPMESASAISAGYDSTACAALAKEAGCITTHTFYDSAHPNPHEDNGSANAKSLNMKCLESNR